jgi:hypothetical protein
VTITQYSRFLLEKLIVAYFFEEIPRPLWRPEAEVYSLLGQDLVLIGNLLPTFRGNLLHSFTEILLQRSGVVPCGWADRQTY